MPFDPKPIAWFAAGAIVGAAALAVLRKKLKPVGFPSLVDALIEENKDLEHFPKELQHLLRTPRLRTGYQKRSPSLPDVTGSTPLRRKSTMTLVPRETVKQYGRKPGKTDVVRVALTGGPCAGKSSALQMIRQEGNDIGFDVYMAPETATLIFASGFKFDGPPSPELKLSFQLAMQRLQLQLERSLTNVASATGRPSIIVFDRGLLDSKGYNSKEGWEKILEGIGAGDQNEEFTGVTEAYLLARYDAVIHLVTAAHGAEEFYKFGWTEDDSGNKVFRSESPQEARDLDQKMIEVWKDHHKHIVVPNVQGGCRTEFKDKIRLATEAVMVVAKAKHPLV